MIDSELDDFAKGKLGDHEVPVPAGLWDKVADGQFDQFVGNTLKETEVPVPAGLWDRISDAQFDSFIGDALADQSAPVPTGLWNKIADGQFDGFVGDKLTDVIAPVPAGAWEKITDGQFDQFVAGKLYDYEAPVPAGLWKKIKPEEDDDHGGLVWFRSPGRAVALVLLIIGLLGGGYYWYRHSQDNTGGGGSQAVQPAQKTPVQPGNNTGSSLPLDNTDRANGDQANTPAGNAPGEQPAVNQPASGSTTGEQAPANQADQLRGDNKAQSGITINSTNHRKSQQADPLSSANSGTATTNNRRSITGELNPNNNQAANNKKANGNDQAPLNGSNGLLAPPPAEDNFGFIEPYQQNHLQAGNTIPTDVSRSDYSLNALDKKAVARHYGQFKSVIICPSDKNRNTDWFLEAYMSPDIAFRSITNNTASQAYLLRKDSSESMRVGYTAGIRLVKPITDNFMVKAGVQYTQMNQKYVYRTENEVKTITVVSTRTIIRAPGDTVIVRDTSVLQQIGFKNNTVINRFRTIDLPVMLGYQFGNDDLKIGVNAGVVVNLSSWYQGVMLDSSLATVPIVKGSTNSVYKNNIGLGLVGSVSLVKKLGEDLHIFAEPYFRYNFSNMTTPNAAYNQKFSLGGIAVGVRLNLNRQ